MFLIQRDQSLNYNQLGKIIQQYQTSELPKLQHYINYYDGKQKILSKLPTDIGKVCNQVVVNYCSQIVDTYSGYLTGIEIKYDSQEDIDDVLDVLNYNDVHSEDNLLLQDALVCGKAVEINYIDEEGKQRFKRLDPRECIDVYDDTLSQNLLFAIRIYSADYMNDIVESYFVEVYDSKYKTTYKSHAGFSSFELIDQQPHYFDQVPITFFYLNNDHISIFDKVMSMQDAYNELMSGSIDDFDAFADAYLILKGCGADEDDLVSMKENRVLMLDQDADASYLTKSITETQVQELLNRLNDNIHKIASSPDFNDEKFFASSGIALKYKLVGFENKASAIESNMRKALQKRIELIANVLSLKGEESMWRDINIIFTRNLPQNIEETATIINSLRGLVSDKTLLAQIPFVDDVDQELAQLKKEQEENMSLYSFTSGDNEDEQLLETESER